MSFVGLRDRLGRAGERGKLDRGAAVGGADGARAEQVATDITGTSGPKLIGITSPVFSSIRRLSGTTGSARTERTGKRTVMTARVRSPRQVGCASPCLSTTLPVRAEPCGFSALTG